MKHTQPLFLKRLAFLSDFLTDFDKRKPIRHQSNFLSLFVGIVKQRDTYLINHFYFARSGRCSGETPFEAS